MVRIVPTWNTWTNPIVFKFYFRTIEPASALGMQWNFCECAFPMGAAVR
jgi:hypothetical protein